MRKLNFKLYNLRVVTCNKLKHIIFKNKKLNLKILKNNNKLNPTKKKKKLRSFQTHYPITHGIC